MHQQIKSFEDACKVLGIAETLPDVTGIPEEDQSVITSHYKLIKIAEAINGGWTPDWADNDQPKYYPLFNMDPSDGGFSYDDWDLNYQGSLSGSHLSFEKAEVAEYVGRQFVDLYKQMLVI